MTTKDRLLSSLPFACQAYDDEASARQFCAEHGYQFLGMIEIDPDATGRILADESGPLAFLRKVLPPDGNPWGDLIYDPAAKTAHFSIRGTGSGLEWIADALCRLVSCRYFPGMVHEGMQLVLDCIIQSLRALILKIPGTSISVHIHGHSLGCALTGLFARILGFGTNLPIEVYMWESPRFLGRSTADAWNAALPNAYRVTNEMDLVPQLPPHNIGYGDVGQEIEVHGGWQWDDLKVAHHLETGPGPGVAKLT